jgi:tetratricopeptide (TPR) repeat protein
VLNKKLWIGLGVTAIVTFLCYIIFSIVPPASVTNKMKKEAQQAEAKLAGVTIDTILNDVFAKMKPEAAEKIKAIYDTLKQPGADKKLIYNDLASIWYNANLFEPMAHAQSELAQLENSEKSLTFAAHSILYKLFTGSRNKYTTWSALESRKLFEQALQLNPNNDSSKIGLGATYFYYSGNEGPMQGILKVKAIADSNTNNAFAQFVLGIGNSVNGSTDLAIKRFENVIALDPNNADALLRLADLLELTNKKDEAIATYKKLLPLAINKEQVKSINDKISSLKK